MTAQESLSRDRRMVQRIHSLMQADPRIGDLTVRIVQSRVIVEGTVADADDRDRILPLVRRAGVMAQVQNDVRVA